MDSLKATDAASAAVVKNPETRVSLASMEAKVVGEEYMNPMSAPHMTICVLTLANGFLLVGKSTPADPANFDRDLGMQFAREDAMRQLWPLEGYLMREKLAAPGAAA